MVTLHSLLRWLVLLSAVVALIGYGRALARSRLDDLATRLGSIYAIVLGVQFLAGLVLWFEQARWNGEDVFRSFIHPTLMITAIGTASAGTARARRTGNAMIGLVAVVVSLVIIVLAIPSGAWPL
jgi:CDP-diglyceride synthetase